MIQYFRLSLALRPPLRIGLLLDTAKVSAFCARVIEDIQRSNFARIELVVFRKSPAKPLVPNPSASLANKLARRLLDPKFRKHILYNAYLHLDRRKKPANHPLDPVACSYVNHCTPPKTPSAFRKTVSVLIGERLIW